MIKSTRKLPVNGVRLWADLTALGQLTEPDRPYTRRSFTPMFQSGRQWLARRFAEAGLAVRLDAAGNLIGRLAGGDPTAPTIMLGSHSDTVPSGGRFDGIAGVLAGLEVARTLRGAGSELRHALEVVDFLAEEPSDYGLSCIGSRAMAGLLTPQMLGHRNGVGETLGSAMDRIGANVSRLDGARRDDIAAYFELHIEQGCVLEETGTDLGIVTGIVGVTRLEIRFTGRADHAGTTTMHQRRDAALAAAATIMAVAEQAHRRAAMRRGHFVATVGVLDIAPNAANVVPGEARLVVDIRAEDDDLTRGFLTELDGATLAIAAKSRVERTGWTLFSAAKPAPCAPALRQLLRASADRQGYSSLAMASGAGHDAAFISLVAPSAMLFIPCRDGRSHTPEEWAEPDALAAGASVLWEAVKRFDAEAYGTAGRQRAINGGTTPVSPSRGIQP